MSMTNGRGMDLPKYPGSGGGERVPIRNGAPIEEYMQKFSDQHRDNDANSHLLESFGDAYINRLKPSADTRSTFVINQMTPPKQQLLRPAAKTMAETPAKRSPAGSSASTQPVKEEQSESTAESEYEDAGLEDPVICRI